MKRTVIRFAKRMVHWSPRGVTAGEDAYIYRPRRVDGGRFVRLGARSTIDKFGWISAIDTYAGVHYTPEIVLGDDVHIGRFSCLTSISSITIEDGCLLSEHVYVSDLAHGLNPDAGLIVEQNLVSKGPVRIGKHSFIGYRACVMPGVVLGEHCIVGANSVVTRSFPAFSMVAGCPAMLIKRYSPESKKWISAERCLHCD